MRARVGVQLTGTGESGIRVEPGDKVAHSPGGWSKTQSTSLNESGVTPGEGVGLLEQQGYHIEVRADRVRLGR